MAMRGLQSTEDGSVTTIEHFVAANTFIFQSAPWDESVQLTSWLLRRSAAILAASARDCCSADAGWKSNAVNLSFRTTVRFL